jgi:FixJ family two-component response regulator
MSEERSIVFVVDDDQAVRQSMESLLVSLGHEVLTFGNALEFLGHPLPDAPACLILDMRLPGLSGLDLQSELIRAGATIPIIFVTGHGDLSIAEVALKAGAVAFLTKPPHQQRLLDAIEEALRRARGGRQRSAALKVP